MAARNRGTIGTSTRLAYTKPSDPNWEHKQENKWARRSGKITTRQAQPGETPTRKNPVQNSPFRKNSTRAQPPPRKNQKHQPLKHSQKKQKICGTACRDQGEHVFEC